jgi:hypothetical protein
MLNERFKSNFQIKNKIRAQELKTRTWDMQDKNENKYLIYQHMQTWIWKKHDKVMM